MPSRVFQPGLLEGQVAIVSGGGSGLGRAAALELAALGTRVVVCGRREEPLRETAERADGDRVEAIACDIREEQQVHALVDGTLDRHGRIDLLVNNAGGQFLTPAEDISAKGFRTVMRLNVEGTWLMSHAVATRAMMRGPEDEPQGGKIVNVTLSPHHGLPGMAHSSAARAAVENLTRVLSIEWARFDIRLTAVAAGHFATDTLMTKYPKAVVERVADTVPLGRLGREEEFAWLVAFLAGPGGDYFSGAILTLDGARDNWFGAWPPGGGPPPVEERRPKRWKVAECSAATSGSEEWIVDEKEAMKMVEREGVPDPEDLPEGTARENPQRERASMDYDLDTSEDPVERRAEREAAAEAAAIGGPAPDYAGPEEDRALEEGGGGVAEGFEESERELIESAEHGDPRFVPDANPAEPEIESDRSTAEYGEADEEIPPDG